MRTIPGGGDYPNHTEAMRDEQVGAAQRQQSFADQDHSW
jgi:hypothetical protein